jgi:hypothetical protein
MGFYGRTPQQVAEEWMRNSDNAMNMMWGPYTSALMAARNSQGPPPPARGDFVQPPLHDIDPRFLMERRPMFPGSPYGAHPYFHRPFPMELLAQLQNTNMSSYLREQELRFNPHFNKDDMMMPLVVEPRNRPKYICFDLEFLTSL